MTVLSVRLFLDAMRHKTDRSNAMSRVASDRKYLGGRSHFLNSCITIERVETFLCHNFFYKYIGIHFCTV